MGLVRAVLVWMIVFAIAEMRTADEAACCSSPSAGSLSVLTPFYHPYARLWLPLEAFGWLLLGGAFVDRSIERRSRGSSGAALELEAADGPLPWFASVCWLVARVLAILLGAAAVPRATIAELARPSDSLRQALSNDLGELAEGT